MPPARVVSVVASNTEIVCALGLGERLVGLDNFSDFPPEVQHLPRVGRDLEIDVARVAALRPDLVLASLSVPGMERVVARLGEAGLAFVVVPSGSWQRLWDGITLVAEALGAPERGRDLGAELRARAERVAASVPPDAPRPSVYWEWWPRPPITAGGPSWITEMCALAGGRNLFADLERESGPVEPDEVARRDPDIVALCYCGARKLPDPAKLLERPGWAGLSAMRKKRVYTFLEPCFGRPGPRLLDGLEHLAAILRSEFRVLRRDCD